MAITETADAVQRWSTAIVKWQQRHYWLNGEIVASGLLLILSIYFFYDSLQLGLSKGSQAAPGSFPALVSAGLIVCCVLWLGNALLKVRRPELASTEARSATPAEQSEPEAVASGEMTTETSTWRVVFVVAWSAIMLPFTNSIGMTPMLFIYLTGLLTVVARATPWKAVLILAIVLLLFSWGAYEAGIYLPDPLRIGPTMQRFVTQILGR